MEPKKRRRPREQKDVIEIQPPRRYMQSPLTEDERAPMESRVLHDRRFRKRHAEIPEIAIRLERLMGWVLCTGMLLIGCNASAPLGEVPTVQERFADWAAARNAEVLTQLPGDTPEPGTALYEAVNFNTEKQEEQLVAQMATPAPAAQDDENAAPVFKHYEPGELAYHTDNIDVTIEQKTKGNMTYFVADIQLSDVSQLRTAFAGDDFKSGIFEASSDIAARYSPVLAINADFCRYHREGVIIRNGEVLRRQNITKHHLLIVDKEGNLSAETDRSGKQGLVANRLEDAETWQTFEFGPVLVRDGEAVALPKSFLINCNDGYYEPRTAIGQIGPLHYIVIVVDGRRDGYSVGASMPQLQELFVEEGAQFAFNLDGGGSTTLYFLGDVVNMPSGGKERSVSDVLMFMANPR